MATDTPVVDDPVRRLLESVKDLAIFMLDPHGKIVTWNPGAEQLIGYREEEILGRHYECLHPADEIERGKPETVLRTAATEGQTEEEGWRVRKDGSRFWARGLVSAIRDASGNLQGFAKITRDHTERHRSEVLLRSILEHTTDGIICVDSRGCIESFNPAAERIFGYAEADVLNRDVSTLMQEPARKQGISFLESCMPAGRGRSVEVVGVRRGGATFPLEVAVDEFQLEGARHFTATIRDLSERKKLENQLRQSQKMEAIGQLAAGVAHDFNNLLTVIASHVDLVLDDLPIRDPSRGSLVEVIHAVERAAALTRQLLAFSSQQVLEPVVLKLNGVVSNVERMLRRLIGEDITLATALGTSVEAVRADPNQLEQVIMNLAVNARDAMPRGGKLTIETGNVQITEEECLGIPECKPGHYVLLAISDTGQGMSPEVRARIFEPFYTTKAPGKGTGLGLSTVYGIVRQSGGWIGVYSEVGIGSTFKVYLPAVQHVSSGESQSKQPPKRPGGGSETILLVEDEGGLRGVIVTALRSYGYRVLDAASGAEALTTVAEQTTPIDLLLTDVVMPEMSGRELAETLANQMPGLPVLFMSGYTNEAVIRHGVLQADMAFIQKPFGPPTLAKKVREVLDSAKR